MEFTDESGLKNEKNETDISYNTWDSMDLKEDLLRGIYANGFEKPSYIQSQSIPIIISGKDTIAQAQSGMGKTGAFSISTLQKINTEEFVKVTDEIKAIGEYKMREKAGLPTRAIFKYRTMCEYI